jgi:hypothetical protein
MKLLNLLSKHRLTMDSLTWELMQAKLLKAASHFVCFKTSSVPGDQEDPYSFSKPIMTLLEAFGRVTRVTTVSG